MDHRCPLGPPQLLTSTTMNTKHLKTYIIRTCGLGGYWAVDDESFIAAARLLYARGVGVSARVRLDIVAHDEHAEVDDYGAILMGGKLRPDAVRVEVGVFTLGHVLKSDGL